MCLSVLRVVVGTPWAIGGVGVYTAALAPRLLARDVRARASVEGELSIVVPATVDLGDINLIAVVVVVAVGVEGTDDAELFAEDSIRVFTTVWGSAHGNPDAPIRSSRYFESFRGRGMNGRVGSATVIENEIIAKPTLGVGVVDIRG